MARLLWNEMKINWLKHLPSNDVDKEESLSNLRKIYNSLFQIQQKTEKHFYENRKHTITEIQFRGSNMSMFCLSSCFIDSSVGCCSVSSYLHYTKKISSKIYLCQGGKIEEATLLKVLMTVKGGTTIGFCLSWLLYLGSLSLSEWEKKRRYHFSSNKTVNGSINWITTITRLGTLNL